MKYVNVNSGLQLSNFRLATNETFMTHSKATTRCVLWKKVFLKILQNSQENTCARVSFQNKVAGLGPATLLKKTLGHSCFPVNFAKFLRTPFSQNTFFTEHLFHRTPPRGCFYTFTTCFVGQLLHTNQHWKQSNKLLNLFNLDNIRHWSEDCIYYTDA